MNRRIFLTKILSLIPLCILNNVKAHLLGVKETPRILDNFNFWGNKFGFNLQNFFMVDSKRKVEETEIKLIKDLGFNFVCFPMDYRCWTKSDNLYKIDEAILKEIDEGINTCIKYGIHVCLNFHRAPGWTVAKPEESLNLWKDEESVKVCAFHWKVFAERYKHYPKEFISYNLLNEPPVISENVHRRVIGRIVDEIRKIDEDKFILCDGRMWGAVPPLELIDLDIIASFHMYHPFTITHYKAQWAGKWEGVPVPTYPLKENGIVWDKDTIEQKHILPWKKLQDRGVPVFVGEFGAYNRTPHSVVMGWMKDCLDIFKKYNWGWALWNFRGAFGPLDSGRLDVEYEKVGEVTVDKEMLNLLKMYATK